MGVACLFMRIMGDLDGCGYKFVPAFADYLSEKRGQPRASFPQALSWSFYKQPGWDLTSPQFIEAMEDAIINYDLFHRGGAYPDFEWAMQELAEAGHEIYIVTARNYSDDTLIPSFDQTWGWLNEREVLPYIKDVIIIGGSDNKIAICKELGIQIGIDDAPHHYNDLEANGIPCMLFDQPWNQEVRTSSRISGWVEFVVGVEKSVA